MGSFPWCVRSGNDLQICAGRDGAHGEMEAGIYGKTDKGAYSDVVGGEAYANIDMGRYQNSRLTCRVDMEIGVCWGSLLQSIGRWGLWLEDSSRPKGKAVVLDEDTERYNRSLLYDIGRPGVPLGDVSQRARGYFSVDASVLLTGRHVIESSYLYIIIFFDFVFLKHHLDVYLR